MAITTELDNVVYNYALSCLTEMMILTVMTVIDISISHITTNVTKSGTMMR